MGWLYEVACVYVMFGIYVDRGVLHLPACPIYGFGMLLMKFFTTDSIWCCGPTSPGPLITKERYL